MRKTVGSVALALVLASVVSGVVGSGVQTVTNLATLQAAGPEAIRDALTPALRLNMFLHDVVHFAPVYSALSALSFIFAFPVAGLVTRTTSRIRTLRSFVYMLASFTALLVALGLGNWLAPMPAFIVVTHTWTGLLAMSASGLFGGWVFALCVRPKSSSGALEHVEFR